MFLSMIASNEMLPFYHVYQLFFFQIVSRNFFYVFNPFTTKVWLALLGALAVSMVTITTIDLVTGYIVDKQLVTWKKINLDAPFKAVCIFLMQCK